MRRCIGCNTSYPQEDLIRLTCNNGIIIPDDGSRKEGRGLYICKKQECLNLAIKKKAFNRALKMPVDAEEYREVIERIINNTKEEI